MHLFGLWISTLSGSPAILGQAKHAGHQIEVGTALCVCHMPCLSTSRHPIELTAFASQYHYCFFISISDHLDSSHCETCYQHRSGQSERIRSFFSFL